MVSSELVERSRPRAAGATVAVRARARPLWDVLAVAWVVLLAFVVLAPALRPGWSLGPFDLLSRFGLTFRAGASVHNPIQADQIQQFVPWTKFAWQQVHAGKLPLWNPYNVLGTPLAFNWQSGVFSLPVAVGYLFPVHLAYTITVLTKLLIAGTGAYVLCRMMGLSPLAAAFGGTVFELSGAIVVHAGWSMTGVMVFAGWILAAALGVLRSPRPWRYTLLLAVSVALAVYGGHPESLAVLALCTVVFTAIYVLAKGTVTGSVPRRLGLLAAGGVSGLGLSAPLLLPGLQLGLSSTHEQGAAPLSFPVSHLPNVLAAGLQGIDFRTATYVGVITVTMAVAGTRVSWHRPEVRALFGLGALCALLTFFGPLDRLLQLLPAGRSVDWARGVMVLALCLGVLGATGIDAVAKGRLEDREPVFARWAGWAVGACALIVILVALAGFLGVSQGLKDNLDRLIAPAVEILLVTLLLSVAIHPSITASLGSSGRWLVRHGAPVLLVTESVVLVAAGVGFWSVSHGYFPTTTGTRALQADVGSSLVGLGTCNHVGYVTPSSKEVGIRADSNIAYGVEEFAVYDPILPASYFRLWHQISGIRLPASFHELGVFCAKITDVQEARLFGISYILEPDGARGPVGTSYAGAVGDEGLYRVPGSARATLTALPSEGSLSLYARGTPVNVVQSDDGTWKMVTDATTPQMLRLRLTAVPGWRASIDGRPLGLKTWADHTMLEAVIPPGRHSVEVSYWPRLFSAGIVVALCTLLVCLAVSAADLATRRGRAATSRKKTGRSGA